MLYGQLPPTANVQPDGTAEPLGKLSANQLDDLVAPIALYPDPLISQILVAATYPIEVVEAYQWLQRNPGLAGSALTATAETQMWDPSIQALVMFPDVMNRLNEDIAWTTNLGNAFLSQEADVMNAIQRMRLKAQQSGKLISTPQQQVITAAQTGPPVIEIVPANPEVLYVPVYDPVWIWGPPMYYPYPRWSFAPHSPVLFFGPGIPVVSYLGRGWNGWAGWGWHPAWGSHSVIVNNTFIHRYHFNSTHVASLTGTTIWSHDAFHRNGVPYLRPQTPLARAGERMGNRLIVPNSPDRNRSAFGGINRGYPSRVPAANAPRALAPMPHSVAPARGRQNPGRGRGK